MSRLIVVAAVLTWLSADFLSAAEWATLRGRIVYRGEAPVPEKITVDKDQEVCGKYDLFEESLIVNHENHGLRDVMIMLQIGRGETVEIHDSYNGTANSDILLDNTHCRFEPHVTLLRTTQKLVIRNSDPIGNNVKIDMHKNLSINLTVPTGTTHTQLFPKAETLPARISCSIHSWELAWLVVKDHPYMAVTDKDGNFEIKNVPAGKRKFMFWQEQAGYLREVTINGTQETWDRGSPVFDLRPGDNDVGEIVVEPSLFEH